MKGSLGLSALGRVNVNKPQSPVELQSYWCRIVETAREPWNSRSHSHSFWELHICLKGSCMMEAASERMELRAGWMVLLTPGKKHTILSETEDFVKFVWGFDFRDLSVNDVLCREYEQTCLVSATEEIKAALQQVMENAACDAFGAYDLLKGGLYRIFTDLVRKGHRLPNGISPKEPSEELLLIRQYLLENPKTTTEDVSELFHLSRSTLERLCKAAYQMSFHQFRQSLQAERIRQLLRETDLTMDQIAAMTGFADRYSMGKFFKKQEGTPPGNYRKAVSKR